MDQIGAQELFILTIVLVAVVIGLVIAVVPFWMISKKAGYPPAVGLLVLVPLVSLVYFYYLAFAQWPVLAELARLRQAGSTPAGRPPFQ